MRTNLFLLGTFGLVAMFAISAHGQPLPTPLVYFPFDNIDIPGGDFSGNGNGGVLRGPATISAAGTGRTGQASDRALDLGVFNNGAYVDIPSAASGGLDSLMENNEATISLWIFGNEQQPQANWTFNAQGPTSNRVLGTHSPWSDGTIYYDVSATGACCQPNHRISAPAPSPDDFRGRWNHYAYLKNGDMTAVYINGNLHVDSGTNVIDPIVRITQFTLGAFGGATQGGSSHGGMFDDFALFDVALTPTQIADIAGGAAIPGITLLGDFDNSGSITAADFQILATNMGAHLRRRVGHEDGDFDLNGRVDLHDFRRFKAAFPGAFAEAAAVPEPSSLVLLVLAVGLLLPVGLRRFKRSGI